MRDRFAWLLELDPADIRLDCALLHLARDAYLDLDVVAYLRRLDALAERVAACRPGLSAPLRYKALYDVLVGEEEYRGDEDDCSDPQNYYLNRVLERHRGAPVTLSVIWIEVARRLKWPVAGVGLPGHFLVRIDDPERFVLADPFRDGRTLDLRDCQRLVAWGSDRRARRWQGFLRPLETRAILVRVLRNLRTVYLAGQNWPRLEQVLRRLALLEPARARHAHELAALHWRLGRYRQAFRELATYLQRRPNGDDLNLVRQRLAHLEAVIASSN